MQAGKGRHGPASMPLSAPPKPQLSVPRGIGAGAKESADYEEHAHGLGAGPSAMLGFAEAAVGQVWWVGGQDRGEWGSLGAAL